MDNKGKKDQREGDKSQKESSKERTFEPLAEE